MNNNITRKECQLNITNIMSEMKDIKKEVGDIKVQIAGLPEEIRKTMIKNFVSQDSFKPVQRIAYGLVGAVMIGVIGAVLALVFK